MFRTPIIFLLLLGCASDSSACADEVDAPPRTDALGDPLPPGGLLRLGTRRFWHGDTVTALVYSPDGRTLISAGWDGTVRFWDAATGKELRRLAAYRHSFVQLALSPDGRTLASVGGENTVRVWDAGSGKQLQTWDEEGPCTAVAISPDGKRLAIGGKDVIRLRDVANPGEVRVLRGVGGEVQALAFSPDGKGMLSGSSRTPIATLWDPVTGKKLRYYANPMGGDTALSSVAFSPDSRTLAVAGNDGKVYLFEWDSVEMIGLLAVSDPNHKVVSIAFAPDGQTLAAASSDTMQVWQVATAKRLHTHTTEGIYPRAVAFAPDGKTLASAGLNGLIRLWDPIAGKERPVCGPRISFAALTFAAGGRELASVAGSVGRVLDARTGKELRKLDLGEGGAASQTISPDGRTLAVVHGDRAIHLLDVATGKELRTLEVPEGGGVERLCFSADGKGLAAAEGSSRTSLWLWELESGRRTDCIRPSDASFYVALAWAPDGRTLISRNVSGAVHVWEVRTGKERRRIALDSRPFRDGSPCAVTELVISPDSKLLAVGLSDSVRLIELRTGKAVGDCQGHGGAIVALGFSPDGKLLASGGVDKTVRLWEIATGKELARIDEHRDCVRCVAFAPDGKRLLTASDDTTAVVWDVAELLRIGVPAPARDMAVPAHADCWADLASEDAARADTAMRELLETPRETVAFLGERLRPVVLDPQTLPPLIADLDSSEFEAREKAARALEALRELAVPALRQALGGRPTAEVRRQAEQILDTMERQPLSSEQLQTLRAVEVLEQLGTAEARGLLEKLAAGAPEARQTREAKTAMERLKQRPGTP
jgi:WD40 repeat protein